MLGGGFETTIVLGALLLTASFIVAIVLVTGMPPDRRRLAAAYAVGVLVCSRPRVVALLGFLALPAVLYLALMGWAVPLVLVEGAGIRQALARAPRLARADYVHAAGGLATLVIVFWVIRLMLALLIRSGGEVTERSTAVLVDLVLSPILFVGSAILYLDQAARFEARK